MMSKGLPPENGHPASAKRQPATPVIARARTMNEIRTARRTLGAFHRRVAVWARRFRAGKPWRLTDTSATVSAHPVEPTNGGTHGSPVSPLLHTTRGKTALWAPAERS